MHDQTIHFTLNDASTTCVVPSYWTLYDVLHAVDAFADLPVACPEGDCCRCTVQLDGRAVCACHVLAFEAAGGAVVTRSGLAEHPMVAALEDLESACGSCIDAFALAAIDHLDSPVHGDERRLEESLLAIPCTCHIEPQVRRVVRRLAYRHSRQAL